MNMKKIKKFIVFCLFVLILDYYTTKYKDDERTFI